MKILKPYKQFKLERAIYSELSSDEKKVLPLLIKACSQVAIIYSLQARDKDQYKGASLYPHNVSDAEIANASKTNPEILSPYSVVEKDKQGLLSIPYHVKYKDNLERISSLLKKAAALSKNKSLASYLLVASQSLLSGDYKKMDTAWLNIHGTKLQFVLGPYQRLLDNRFFTKTAYGAFVGISDNYYTKKSENIRDVIFTTLKEKPARFTLPSSIELVPVRNLAYGGFSADSLLSSEDFPQDEGTIKKHGSKLIGYLTTMDYKFDRLLYPIFSTIFEKTFQKSYSEDLLRQANYYQILVYGLFRQLERYEGSRERLKDLFPILKEVNSVVTGISNCKQLILKGVLEQKELEAIIIMHICWVFSEWVFSKNNPVRRDFLSGNALALNFYMNQEALHELNGISWPNFSKIFFVIENLSSILTRLLETGSYEEAENFIDKNLSYTIFKSFDSRLSKIPPLK